MPPELQPFIDPVILDAIFSATMIGSGAAVVRAFQMKEKARPFVMRIVSGAIMGAILGYAFRNSTMMPDIAKVFVFFAGGFMSGEIGALLSDLATETLGKSLSSKKDDQ